MSGKLENLQSELDLLKNQKHMYINMHRDMKTKEERIWELEHLIEEEKQKIEKESWVTVKDILKWINPIYILFRIYSKAFIVILEMIKAAGENIEKFLNMKVYKRKIR